MDGGMWGLFPIMLEAVGCVYAGYGKGRRCRTHRIMPVTVLKFLFHDKESGFFKKGARDT